jgi:putative Mg2+ transporter-C (MgtC) family protein
MMTSQFLLHIGTALLLGSLIGAERQWRQRMAGLRTNTLVCLGATLYVSMSTMVADEVSPTRIAAQVVSGIGFLGAGVIFKEGLTIRGLNTAATLWCSAAVGVLIGAGFLGPAAVGAGAVLITNMVMRPMANAINRQPSENTEVEMHYRLKLVCRAEDENHIRASLLDAVDNASLTIHGLWSEDTEDSRNAEVRADLFTYGRQDAVMEQVLRRLSREPGVTAISWESESAHRN